MQYNNLDKREAFRNALLSAYSILRELDADYSATISRFTASEGRALFAWSKLQFENWDNVARTLVLLTGFHEKLSRTLHPLAANNGELTNVANLQCELKHAVVMAIQLLKEIVDDYADFELAQP